MDMDLSSGEDLEDFVERRRVSPLRAFLVALVLFLEEYV